MKGVVPGYIGQARVCWGADGGIKLPNRPVVDVVRVESNAQGGIRQNGGWRCAGAAAANSGGDEPSQGEETHAKAGRKCRREQRGDVDLRLF